MGFQNKGYILLLGNVGITGFPERHKSPQPPFLPFEQALAGP